MTMTQSPSGRGRDETGRGEAEWIDPVCGMNVRRLSAVFASEQPDRMYRFCSEACRAKFEAAPDRYRGMPAISASRSDERD